MPIIPYNPLPNTAITPDGYNAQNNTESRPVDPTPTLATSPNDVTSLKALLKAIGFVVRPQEIESQGFITGEAGWAIYANGNVEFNNGVFRGALTAATIDIGGSDDSSFHVDIGGNLWSGGATLATSTFSVTNAGYITAVLGQIGGWTLSSTALTDTAGLVGMTSVVTAGDDIRFWAGNINPLLAPFYVTESGVLVASSATITGAITATSGRIANWYINTDTLSSDVAEDDSNILIDSANAQIRLGAITGDYITLDGLNQRLYSSNYVSGMFGQGFSLTPDLLEVGNISARGTIRTANFQKDVISSIAGGQIISPDCSTLSVDVETTDTTITINSESTFSTGDRLRMKEGAQDEWLSVSGVSSAPTYNVIRDMKGDMTTARDSLIGFWRFNEGSGSVALDSSASANNGVITGATYVAGHLDTELSFSGADYVTIGDVPEIQFERTDPFSVCAWFKSTDSTDNNVIISKMDASLKGWSLQFRTGGKIAMYLINQNSAPLNLITVVTTDGGFDDGVVHDISVTYDGSSTAAGVIIEIDGVSKTLSVEKDVLSASILNAGLVMIGARTTPAKFWVGTIDEVRIYNKVLSAAEKAEIRADGGNFYAWTKGATVVNYGQSGQGLIYQTASEEYSPYQDMLIHAGTPWDSSTNTTKVRVGNLSGITDSDFGGALSGYGIYTTNGYFKGTVDVGSSGAVKGGQTAYATGDGFFLGYESGAYKHSIGNATDYLRYDGTNLFFSGAMILKAPLSLPSYAVADLPIPPTSDGPNSPSSNAY